MYLEHYILEAVGITDCSIGEKIKDKLTCEKACIKLNLPKKEMIDGFVCYKSHAGNCGADTQIGSSASLLCKITG